MQSDPPVEIELKYRLSSLSVGERLLAGDRLGTFVADGPARTAESEDRYMDTRDGALEHAGYAARLRRSRATTLVSVKSLARASGSLQRRIELEGPADRTLPPPDWPASPARSLILELCGDVPLVELVTVRQVRRKRIFRDGETAVEVSLDEVEVIARGRHVDRFAELEIELTNGPEEPLLALRTVLDAEPGISASIGSKLDTAMAAVRLPSGARRAGIRDVTPAEREPTGGRSDDAVAAGARSGDWLQDGGPMGPPEGLPEATPPATEPKRERQGKKAAAAAVAASAAAGLVVGRTPGVTAGDVVAEAGRKVLRFHLARLIAREAGTRLGEDPEELHGMRVATRRMRAAWRVFGDGFRPEGTRRFRNRLRDVAAKLGAVRDIDVLVLELEAYRAPLAPEEAAAMEPLMDDWRAQREAGRIVLTRELDSDSYRQFVDAYRTFVLTPGAGALVVSPTDPHHVRDTAGSRIWRAYENVLAYGPVLRWADVPTLHQLRIAGKWLRYTLEFVAEALGPDAAPLIERVVALQDHLGLMNDAEVAAMKARALLVARTGTLTDAQTRAIAHYLTSREREVARLKRGAAAPWRGLASPAFRRGLGRALANLAASPGGPGSG